MGVQANPIDYYLPIIIGTVLISGLISFIIIFMLRYRQAQLKMKYERQMFEQALLEAEVEIREQTLAYVSRELHDNLGQVASLLKINLNMMAAQEKNHDHEKLNSCLDLTRTLITDIKSLSLSLNSDNIKNTGLIRAIENDVSRINKTGGFLIELITPNEDLNFKPETELLLYRMCQETLNNILQHSKATEVSIEITKKHDNLNITINDNGQGFEIKKVNNKSLGLTNIRDRCKIIGASLEIKSAKGYGTLVEINLPLNN